MFKLYTGPALGGFAPHAILEETKADFELIPIDTQSGEARTEDFRRLNPRAEVPVLELPDGNVMTESSAMVIYLADLLAPDKLAPLFNSPARPAYLRWLAFMVANIYASARRFYYADRHTTDPEGIEAVRESARLYMKNQLILIDDAIGDKNALLESGYSAADIYLTMLTHWYPDKADIFERCGNIQRVCDTVQNRPALQRINIFHKIW